MLCHVALILINLILEGIKGPFLYFLQGNIYKYLKKERYLQV